MRYLGFSAVLLSLCMGFFSACSSPPEKGGRGAGLKRPPQPLLADETTFFAGTIAARVTLGSLAVHREGPAKEGDGGDREGRRPPRSSGGGPGGGGARGGEQGRRGGESGSGEDGDGSGGRRVSMGELPRLSLQASFTNTTAETIEIAVTDFVSGLGNFAVRPESLTLAPGQSGAIDPMISNYPDVIMELPVEVRVRHAGKAESHTLQLRVVAPARPGQP